MAIAISWCLQTRLLLMPVISRSCLTVSCWKVSKSGCWLGLVDVTGDAVGWLGVALVVALVVAWKPAASLMM